MAAKQYVLYAVPSERNSKKAMYLSRPALDHACDPTQLPKRPSWLKGVPTIVHVQTKVVYEGTKCLLYMQKRNEQHDRSSSSSPVTADLLSAPLPPSPPASAEEKTEDVQLDGVFFLDEKEEIMKDEESSVVQINPPELKSLMLEDISTETPVQLMPQHQLTPTLLQRPLIPDDQPIMIIRVDL